jgi:cell wall-associated NlpC family hydrolase
MMVNFRHSVERFYKLFALIVLIGLIAGCASTPEIKPIVRQPPSLIDYALSLQGVPYRYGSETPEDGFDCSGFVKHVYGRHGVRLPRTAYQMAVSLPPLPGDYGLRSGDLVFFNTTGRAYSHVGIFIRDDKFIHASSSRSKGVMVSSLNSTYWRKRYAGARRPIRN